MALISRLKDIGEAVLGPENEESHLRESGIPMIALAIIPQPGSNYVSISDEFYKGYEQIKKEMPEDIKLNIALTRRNSLKINLRSRRNSDYFPCTGDPYHLSYSSGTGLLPSAH